MQSVCGFKLCFVDLSSMTMNVLNILERKISHTRDVHFHVMLMVLNETVAVIRPDKKASVSESLKLFEMQTLSALRDYLSQVRETILLVIQETNTSLLPNDIVSIMVLVEKYIDAPLFISHFENYEGAVVRHLDRYGRPFQLSDFRPDLRKCTYQVGAINIIRTFIASLRGDLDVIYLKQKNNMVTIQPAKENRFEQVNRLIKIEPNIFGLGINLNYLFRRLMKKCE